jgi:hypothetical protein
MNLKFNVPAGQWIKATDLYQALMAKALTGAMKDVGKLGRDRGRQAIAAAGFSDRFANSLVAKLPTQDSLAPTAYIHTTINYADVFERGAVITGKPYIWLPLPTVPAGPGRPHMTPKQYVQNVGPLVTMHRAGKPPMLGARVAIGSLRPQPFGRFVGRRVLRRGISMRHAAQQTQVIPLFVGVPSVSIPKKFDVHAAVQEVFSHLDEFYRQQFEDYDGRKTSFL